MRIDDLDPAAVLAAPAGGTRRAACEVAGEGAAVRANRLTVSVGPADAHHGRLCLCVGHAEDLSEAEGLGLPGEEEVLHHGNDPVCENHIPYVMIDDLIFNR
jgi:hypothetical protein